MLGRAIAASGLLIGLANAGNCPSSNPYAFAGSGVAGSVCCSVATTGSVSGVGTCGAMGGQGWMSYASTCCSGAQTPCNSMGDDPAVPCEHNADILTAYADTDDPWRSLALALATENTAVGSGTPPDGKLAPVLEDSDEPCRGDGFALSDIYECLSSYVLVGVGDWRIGVTDATDGSLTCGTWETVTDADITATVPFARYDPYWIGPPEALPTTTRSISMQFAATDGGADTYIMYVSGDTCKNSDSVAAITDPTSTNEGTLPSRTYSCAKWGRTCITCEDGVKFAGDFDSSLTTSPQSCSTCNACDRAGQQTDDTCTSASDATCECQPGFLGNAVNSVNDAGDDVSGCTACADGFWSAAGQDACTAHSVCDGLGREQLTDGTPSADRVCTCTEGYEGDPTTDGGCLAIPCPARSTGDGATADCECDTGYEVISACYRDVDPQPASANDDGTWIQSECESTRKDGTEWHAFIPETCKVTVVPGETGTEITNITSCTRTGSTWVLGTCDDSTLDESNGGDIDSCVARCGDTACDTGAGGDVGVWVAAACDDGSGAADQAACELTPFEWNDGTVQTRHCADPRITDINSCTRTGSTWLLGTCDGNRGFDESGGGDQDSCQTADGTWIPAACDDGGDAADVAACELTGFEWNDGSDAYCTDTNAIGGANDAATQFECERLPYDPPQWLNGANCVVIVDAADQDSCERMSSGYSYSGPVDRVDAYCANSQGDAVAGDSAGPCEFIESLQGSLEPTGFDWVPASCDGNDDATSDTECQLTANSWTVEVPGSCAGSSAADEASCVFQTYSPGYTVTADDGWCAAADANACGAVTALDDDTACVAVANCAYTDGSCAAADADACGAVTALDDDTVCVAAANCAYGARTVTTYDPICSDGDTDKDESACLEASTGMTWTTLQPGSCDETSFTDETSCTMTGNTWIVAACSSGDAATETDCTGLTGNSWVEETPFSPESCTALPTDQRSSGVPSESTAAGTALAVSGRSFDDQNDCETTSWSGRSWVTVTALAWGADADRYIGVCTPVVCTADDVANAVLSGEYQYTGTGIVVTCNEGFLPCSTCLNTPAVLVCTEAGSIDDAAMDASDVSPEWDDRTACVSVDCGVAVASHGEFSGEHYFGAPDPYSLACEAGYEAVEWTLVQEARCAGGSGAALLSSRQECEDTDNNWADSSADGVDNPICTAADGTTAIASRTTEEDCLTTGYTWFPLEQTVSRKGVANYDFTCSATSATDLWQPRPDCAPVQCSNFVPTFGLADGTEIGTPNSRDYSPTGATDRIISCQEGYLLLASSITNGETTARCGPTGLWDFEEDGATIDEPSCSAITWCDLPQGFGEVQIIDDEGVEHGTRLLDVSDCRIKFANQQLNQGVKCMVHCGVDGVGEMSQAWECQALGIFDGRYPTCQRPPHSEEAGALGPAGSALLLVLAGLATLLLR